MYGFSEAPFGADTFSFENCRIKAEKGLSVSNAGGVSFEGLTLEVKEGEKIDERGAKGGTVYQTTPRAQLLQSGSGIRNRSCQGLGHRLARSVGRHTLTTGKITSSFIIKPRLYTSRAQPGLIL